MNLPTESAITTALQEIRAATRASMTDEPLMMKEGGLPEYPLRVLQSEIARAVIAGEGNPVWARRYWAEVAAIAVRFMLEAER